MTMYEERPYLGYSVAQWLVVDPLTLDESIPATGWVVKRPK